MNRRVLLDGWIAARKLGYTVAEGDPGLVWSPADGCYLPGKDRRCTMIETVLLGFDGGTGDRIADAAKALGVDALWVEGFNAGLSFRIAPADYGPARPN